MTIEELENYKRQNPRKYALKFGDKPAEQIIAERKDYLKRVRTMNFEITPNKKDVEITFTQNG